MTGPDDRPRRPTPRPRPATGGRPSPRPRVAGSRREREDGEPTTEQATTVPAVEHTEDAAVPASTARRRRPAASGTPAPPSRDGQRGSRRGGRGTALVLAVLCLLAAAGGGLLLWQRLHPASVDPTLFAAARSGVEDLYAYDYRDSAGSVERKLAVLTGDLQEQYRQDLAQGGIIDTYEQVSATTSYDVLEVGLQQVNPAQDQATVVVFGQYVVESVNSGSQEAPSGSECTVTDDGAQACTQTVQVTLTKVDGDWKISELTLLTTS